jgi:RimJ/RimL family protein N-acetyltransferase
VLTINFDPFPILSTKRLLLRRIEESDVNEIFILRSDKRVMEFIERHAAKSIEEATLFIQSINDLIKNNEAIQWAITEKTNTKLLGTICIWNISKEHHRGEIGYVLHPDSQGKGLMQEAVTEVINFGFKTLKLHSIEADVNPDNIPSIKLLERNKFSREAHYKENIFFDGKFFDTVVYSLHAPQP